MNFEYLKQMDKMDFGGPSTPDEIEDAENKMSIVFPADYKKIYALP